MNSRAARVKEWMAGIAGLFLLISVGLEVYVGQALGQASVITLLVTLYVASWAFVVGLVGLVVVSGWWLAESLPTFTGPRMIPARQLVLGVGVMPMRVLRSLRCRTSA
jgi:hypothetical protein